MPVSVGLNSKDYSVYCLCFPCSIDVEISFLHMQIMNTIVDMGQSLAC